MNQLITVTFDGEVLTDKFYFLRTNLDYFETY